MTFDENLTRVRELLAQRDEIDRELGELIGGGPKPLSIRDKKPQKVGGKRGRPPADMPAFERSNPADHMTEDQFDELKHLQSTGDLTSKDFAYDNDLELREVNRAIAARNFGEYSNS